MASAPEHRNQTADGRLRRAVKSASGRTTRLRLGKKTCPRCNDTGSIWVVCPDAGAIKLPCECGKADRSRQVGLVDAGLAAAFLACCGVAYLLL